MNVIPDNVHAKKELTNDQTVKTLGLDLHSVSDCFQDQCMGKLDSVKPKGMPQGTTNHIKSEKIWNVDFYKILVVAGKAKKVANFSPPDDKEKLQQIPDDSEIVLPMTKLFIDRFHEFPNQIQFRMLEKRWKTKKTQSNQTITVAFFIIAQSVFFQVSRSI